MWSGCTDGEQISDNLTIFLVSVETEDKPKGLHVVKVCFQVDEDPGGS